MCFPGLGASVYLPSPLIGLVMTNSNHTIPYPLVRRTLNEWRKGTWETLPTHHHHPCDTSLSYQMQSPHEQRGDR